MNTHCITVKNEIGNLILVNSGESLLGITREAIVIEGPNHRVMPNIVPIEVVVDDIHFWTLGVCAEKVVIPRGAHEHSARYHAILQTLKYAHTIKFIINGKYTYEFDIQNIESALLAIDC